MTYILVTNDDGVNAPGILALTQAMKTIGDVSVVAPTVNQSTSGHKKTLFQDMTISRPEMADGTPTVAVDGSPADCIAVAALGLVDWPPRLVVSGINRGANLAQDVTQSGTVSAALEATLHAVPAVAFSLDNRGADQPEHYATAGRVATQIVRNLLDKELPPFTVINVNVPNTDDIRGIRLTRQGVRVYRDELELNGDLVRVIGDPPTGRLDEAGTDLWAVHRNYVSITPIHLDMTAHHFIADVAAWDLTL
jgi:5'-nucleotidase